MRLIDANARVTVQSFDVEHEEYNYTEMSVAEALDFATDEGCPPAVDAASIVRCKDCKNWDSSTEGRYVGGWCFCEKLQFSTSPDWFCADGERVDAPTCGPDYCEIGGGDDGS